MKLGEQWRMNTNNEQYAGAEMLIRKPVSEVFEAFVNPVITTNFWFTKSSGRLDEQREVVWEWEMYNASTPVVVKELVANKKILIEWGTPATIVEWEFTERSADTTYVVVKNYGFNKTGDELIAAIRDSTGGFTTVLDGLKAYAEHGINLNLIGDRFPR